jgi:RimJ/RimL family protein N-acetyltransferase
MMIRTDRLCLIPASIDALNADLEGPASLAAALDVPEVSAVIAETLPELVPSIGVLERCGFSLLGEGSTPGVLRFQLTREDWTSRS